MQQDRVVSAHVALLRVFLRSGSIDGLRGIVLGAPNAYARSLGATSEYRQALESIGSDSALRSLFPDEGEPVRTLVSPVLGIGLDARILPAGFIASAFLRAILEGLKLDEDVLTELIAKAVQQMRAIAATGMAHLPIAVAFDGFALSEPIETPLGRIRPSSGAWAYVTSGHDSPAVECITEMTVHIGSPSQHQLFQDLGAINDRADVFRVAIAIAAGPEVNAKPKTTLVTVVHPYIGFIGMFSPSQGGPVSTPTRPLTLAEQRLTTTTIAELAKTGGSTIDLAFRRLLSAMADRLSPTDRLIDAVTAWENLVGTSTETSFRTCAALAWLLEPESEARRATFRDLRRIYTVRSRVIHGERVNVPDVERAATDALSAGVRAIRSVLLQHPWLLDIDASAARAEALLLGDRRYGH